MFSLLPLLKGWREFSVDLDNIIVVNPGNEVTLAESQYPGWLYSCIVALTGSGNAEFTLERYTPDGKYRRATFKPNDLLTIGLDMPNSSGPFVSEWDTTTQFYTIAFMPSTPLPYWASKDRKCAVKLRAPDNAEIIINDYSQVAYEIYDMKKFIESFREVLGNNVSIEIIKKLMR